MWPGELKEQKTRFGPITYFVHEPSLLEPVLVSFTGLGDVQGCCFSWRSWIWQCQNMSGVHLGKSARVLPVAEVGPCPILEVACRQAFWNLSKTVVFYFASLAADAVSTEDYVCTVLFKVIQGIAKLCDSKVLDLLQSRLSVTDSSAGLGNSHSRN